MRWQRVGMSMWSRRAASRMVAPCGTSTGRLSISARGIVSSEARVHERKSCLSCGCFFVDGDHGAAFDDDAVERAGLDADVALGAFGLVDGVQLVGCEGDRANGASHGAAGAAVAGVGDAVVDQRAALAGGAVAAEVGFVFFAEIFEGG